MKIVYITYLTLFGFKCVFDLKNYGFKNVAFTKNVHIHVIENMNA
jgi:hypothetical protein